MEHPPRAEAWRHAALTVRLAIITLGSSVQREQEKDFKKVDYHDREKLILQQEICFFFFFLLEELSP